MYASIDIQDLIRISKLAGKKILEIYESTTIEQIEKADKSPLTAADLAANTLITTELKKRYPSIPVLSEESQMTDFETRKNWKEFFLVDPLDGTKEFLKRNGEFTVNIAYIRDRSPFSGVVHWPIENITYYSDGEFSYKQAQGKITLLPIADDGQAIRVVASRSHRDTNTVSFINSLSAKYTVETLSMGSSLKLCLIAEGKADVYPRFAPTSEWDTAAAHAVIRTSGGHIHNVNTKTELLYNKENILNPFFIAFNNAKENLKYD